jgi:mRNA interferase RelE/StbE
VKRAIGGLPMGDVKKLQGETNRFRLRVGERRVLFTIDRELRVILVTAVRARGAAY